MLGWKLVGISSVNSYPSAFVRDPASMVTYAVGYETERLLAPLFFFGDELQAADLLRWPLLQEYEVVLLRVEAREPVREMKTCAQNSADFPAFWAATLNGQAWEGEKYRCPPKTQAAAAIVPRMTVWMGARGGRSDAALLPELEAAFETARRQIPGEPVVPEPEPVTDDFTIFLPTISA